MNQRLLFRSYFLRRENGALVVSDIHFEIKSVFLLPVNHDLHLLLRRVHDGIGGAGDIVILYHSLAKLRRAVVVVNELRTH